MTSTPPSLLYLTIYNPTLLPQGSTDDEDAEEQAHILFYTSRERAVSRDKMLRQVGLAKALVNFSEMFTVDATCDNVHSQTRRMIMVSPEPNFWIHAAIELSKTARIPLEKTKRKEGKDKEKRPTQNGKGKEKEQPQPQPIFDHNDSSIHDLIFRESILRGYEFFKLTHGSFTSILSTLGQQALELQLERFFTVWAWSWDLESPHEFGDHLGIPLHPLHRILTPILDDFSSRMHLEADCFVVDPPHLIPSTPFLQSRYPSSFVRHFLSLVHPRVTSIPTPPLGKKSTPADDISEEPEASSMVPSKALKGSKPYGTFLGIPPMNINVNMDMRKWGWPFGRVSGKKLADVPNEKPFDVVRVPAQADADTTEEGGVSIHGIVDNIALQNALTSETIHSSMLPDPSSEIPSSPENLGLGTTDVLQEERSLHPPDARAPSTPSAQGNTQEDIDDALPSTHKPDIKALQSQSNGVVTTPANTDDEPDSLPVPFSSVPELTSPAEPSPEFLSTFVYMSNGENDLSAQRTDVVYLSTNDLTFASFGHNNSRLESVSLVRDDILQLLNDIRGATTRETQKCETETLSATNILQSDDKHIFSVNRFTSSASGFKSTSEHLYNGQQYLESDADILEVFSRGQIPQHWHISRRGLGSDDLRGVVEGEVYMEVSRKETSLTDVDNVLAGTIRRFTG